MKVVGYINEHGAENGFLRVVLSNPPKDNQSYVFSRTATVSVGNLVPVSNIDRMGEFITEKRDIVYDDEEDATALVGFKIGGEIIVGNLSEVLLTLNGRLNELDQYPVLKFTVIDQIYGGPPNLGLIRDSFLAAKEKIARSLGRETAENWQNSQVIPLKLLSNSTLKSFTSVEVLPITSINIQSRFSDDRTEYTETQALRVIITHAQTLNFSREKIDRQISEIVSRYRDDLLVQISYVPVDRQIEPRTVKDIPMSIEQYKVIDTYLIYINNDDNHDDSVTLKAVVLQLEDSEQYKIRYSHTMIPTEQAAGPWYSNSMTNADSPGHAKALIQSFARQMERAYKIVPWRNDL